MCGSGCKLFSLTCSNWFPCFGVQCVSEILWVKTRLNLEAAQPDGRSRTLESGGPDSGLACQATLGKWSQLRPSVLLMMATSNSPAWASLLAQRWSICLPSRRRGVNPWLGKMSWRRKWQPTLVFLPENPMDRGAWWATVLGAQRRRHDLMTQSCLMTYDLATVLPVGRLPGPSKEKCRGVVTCKGTVSSSCC